MQVKRAANGRSAKRAGTQTAISGPGRPIDVTVVLLDGGYASTAIGPVEVFHSAGLLWNGLRGEAPQPRFRVRTASIDGCAVSSTYGVALTLVEACQNVGGTRSHPGIIEVFFNQSSTAFRTRIATVSNSC